MARFTTPRDLYYKKGSLEILKNLYGKRAVICVGGSSMKRYGFLDRAENYLREAGMETMVFDGIESDPSTETVMRGAMELNRFNPDWIVALGGGSVMDCAKAMWIIYENPEISFKDMCSASPLPQLRKKAHFVAISSTSGTASEVSAASVITDSNSKIKYVISDYEITPDIAIVDGDLAETMPRMIVAHTGIDALTHAIESYVSLGANIYSDGLALHGMKIISESLVDSYNGDMDARDRVHDAQAIIGFAFANAGLGITHSIAHKTSAVFEDQGDHITHGAANAMYLPKVVAYNAVDSRAKSRYAEIVNQLNLGGRTEDGKLENLISWLRELCDRLSIPHCIRNYGKGAQISANGFIPEHIFLERLDSMAENAVLDPCTPCNPRKIDREKMAKLIKCCYYDLDVDF